MTEERANASEDHQPVSETTSEAGSEFALIEPPASTRKMWMFIVPLAVVLVAAVVFFAVVMRGDSGDKRTGATPTPTTSVAPSGASSGAAAAPTVPGSSAAAPSDTSSAGATPEGDAQSMIAPELPAVAPDAKATGDDKVQVRLAKVESVDGEAQGPGETAGPAVRLTIEIENGSGTPLNLADVAVNAYVGQNSVPANTFHQPGGSAFEGELAPGEKASGVYLFGIKQDQRNDVKVGVDYRAGTSTVVFRGDLG